jgi:ABC-2 type transport system permease protein
MSGQYRTALRYSVREQTRNRLALGLLVVFVPLWYFLLGTIIPADPLPFRFRATGAFLQVNGQDLTLLTAGFNALTLIVGFMLFASTRSGARFDHRLVLSGYSQPVLILAKLSALVAAAASIALYASLVLLVFWRPQSFALVWLGFFGAALIYGGLGLLLGVLVSSELAGFFIIIMLSLMDTFFQNPYGNPAANKPFLAWFPSYGPVQLAVAGGFTHVFPARELLVALAWFAWFALLGLAIFWRRTRAWNARRHTSIAASSLTPASAPPSA